MNILTFTGAVELGLVYALVAIGVYLSFRILDFPDLTVDGSFLTGAAVCGVAIIFGINPWIAMVLAVLASAGAGLVTAMLNIKFGILNLLASILTMSALYSVNLRIMGMNNGMASVNLPFAAKTAITPFHGLFGLPVWAIRPLFVGTIVLMAVFLVWRFLKSEIGLAMRATGINLRMARAQGIRTGRLVYLGMGLSNALVGLGGALFIQTAGSADSTGGVGTIVFGLAAVIIGESLFRTRNMLLIILSCALGSVLYRIVVQFAFQGGEISYTIQGIRLSFNAATDLQLITALLVVAILVLPGYLGAKKHD
ncbi:MAG: Branched-chain amino acid transport protein [Candidatus Tokpelaia hoelldobleri]|uniref:Branched-chain amino acid transport protein n=1 Tax=Candidatus Tokpelaia hoelldobleri TaxID=1902579 RepID=A0A1U9JX11_9HYPH|nr:MAG: Branched-chain amino acid transport protein [Candidatus Tokpelaia hoelldoblerii]